MNINTICALIECNNQSSMSLKWPIKRLWWKLCSFYFIKRNYDFWKLLWDCMEIETTSSVLLARDKWQSSPLNSSIKKSSLVFLLEFPIEISLSFFFCFNYAPFLHFGHLELSCSDLKTRLMRFTKTVHHLSLNIWKTLFYSSIESFAITCNAIFDCNRLICKCVEWNIFINLSAYE